MRENKRNPDTDGEGENKPIPTENPTALSDEESRVVPAEQLFLGKKEVVIDHDGVRYRLRITRRGKLILHK